jgi:UDP-2,3-diacylglucosamine hydrolase
VANPPEQAHTPLTEASLLQWPGTGPLMVISDLHLDVAPGPKLETFLRFLKGPAHDAGALLILGDLFEYWIGDDAGFPSAGPVAQGLSELACPVHFVHGNRDFLLGEDFASRAGMQLHGEWVRVDAGADAILLAHGDQLCTDDHEMQAFRRQVRDPHWQKSFLARPLPERIAAAQHARAESQARNSEKSMEIMDVSPDAVTECLRLSGLSRLVHGHTHRPARHVLAVDGRACERWVLPSWDEAPGYLVIGADGAIEPAFSAA